MADKFSAIEKFLSLTIFFGFCTASDMDNWVNKYMCSPGKLESFVDKTYENFAKHYQNPRKNEQNSWKKFNI